MNILLVVFGIIILLIGIPWLVITYEFNNWVEDQYIIETISEISSKSKWDCNEATYILHNACLKEWKTRHGSRSVPKIVSEIEMILTDDRDYSIML